MVKHTPLVSVLMSTFNDEAYLATSIDSVLTQDFKDFEFIIINDGSTDGSLRVLNEKAKQDKRIKVISQKNQGLVKSLNYGLKVARGKYIARIDSDDQWLPHKLKTQVDYIESHKSIAIISGGLETIDAHDVPLGFTLTSHTHEQTIRSITISNPFIHSSALFRKDIAVKCGGYPNTCPIEDYTLFSQMLEYGDSYIIPYPIIRYRLNPKGISQQNSIKQSRLANDLSIKLWEKYRPSVLKRKQIAHNCKSLLQASKTKEFGVMLKHYFLNINSRIGIRMIRQGYVFDGIRQILNIALTGRTGLRIVIKQIKSFIKL